MTMIMLGKRPVRTEDATAHGLTTELWLSLTKCWHVKPEDRLTISEMLALLRSMCVNAPISDPLFCMSSRCGPRSQARSSTTVGRTSPRRDTSTTGDGDPPPSDGFPLAPLLPSRERTPFSLNLQLAVAENIPHSQVNCRGATLLHLFSRPSRSQSLLSLLTYPPLETRFFPLIQPGHRGPSLPVPPPNKPWHRPPLGNLRLLNSQARF